jgi:hypothetical protein
VSAAPIQRKTPALRPVATVLSSEVINVRTTTNSVETAAVPLARSSKDGHARLTQLLILTNASIYVVTEWSKRGILLGTVTMGM